MLSALAEKGGGRMLRQKKKCSEGEEGAGCPPLAGMCSQLVGKDMPGASTQIWHHSLLRGPVLSFMVLF